MAIDSFELLGVLNAAALLALGAALLRRAGWAGPRFLLGWFAVLWGVQVLMIRLALEVADPGTFRVLALLALACYLPLPLLMAQFAVAYPRRLRIADNPAWVAVAAAPPALAVAAYLVDPASLFAPGRQFVFGWAAFLLAFVPFQLANVAALGRFVHAYATARSAVERNQSYLAALALLVFVAGTSVGGLANLGPGVREQVGDAGFVIYGSALALGAAAGPATVVAMAAAGVSRERFAALLAALVGSAAVALAFLRLASLDASAALRLVEVPLLAYAVVRYQLLDLEVRLRAWARPVATLAFGLGAWGALAAAGTLLGGVTLEAQPAAFLGTAGLAAGLALAAHGPIGRWLDARFPSIPSSEEAALRRRLEVYRAAIDSGAAPGSLDALAASLRLGPRERGALDRAAAPQHPGRGAPGLPARYRVEEVLAGGLYGRVLLAWDERLGERVVLKEFAGFAGPGAAESFAREAKILGGLDHPHILAVLDVFRAGDDMYLALEHAPEGSLEDRLRARGALPGEEALDVARQVLEGLAAAHRAGVVHRDVKPANILFRRGVAKVADFGIAADPALDAALRAVHGAAGSLAWMAPEQARGEAPTQRSDVHAVGAVLRAMLAGPDALPPQGPQRLPRDTPREVAALLDRALAEDPADRFPDAAAMLRDVKRVLRALRGARAGGA